MKRFAFLGCIAAALLSFVGCDETGKDGYEGINYIYLSSEGGKTTILESDQTPLSVEVMLTTALEEDLTVAFAVNGTEGVVELQNNPVTIKAGEKTASFEIVSLNAGKLSEAANFTVTLDAAAVLPENVELKSPFAFVVNPAPATGELTAEQQAIIDAYKAATGINLSKYLGAVNVTAVISGYDVETGEAFEEPKSGKTVIALSAESTLEVPVLEMTSNAMGVQDYMYKVMKAVTVDDVEDLWFPDAYAMECYAIFTEAIGWNSSSDETFNVSLDGITLSTDKTVNFVTDYVNSYDEESIIVPFEFLFSAFEREKTADFANAAVKPGDDEWLPDCTADPTAHLNLSGLAYDEYEMEDEGYYVEPSAEIKDNGELVFTFCFDHRNASDYTRVVATITPNN